MNRKWGRAAQRAGAALLLAAALLSGYNLLDGARAERCAQAVLEGAVLAAAAVPREETELTPVPLLAPEAELPVTEVDGLQCVGILRIPALSLELPVQKDWSARQLRRTPCLYSGRTYQDALVIAAHNYPAHFGLLHRLSCGDGVELTDMEGNTLSFTVAGFETLRPTAVEEMVSGEWPLTLFTCTPGGQDRLAVRCIRSEPAL